MTGQLPGGGMALFVAPAPVVRGTNSLAVAALVCGVAEFFTVGLTAIPAVILGHMARGQIRRTGEQGSGLALAGLILGWVAIILFVLVVALGAVAAVTMTHGSVMHSRPRRSSSTPPRADGRQPGAPGQRWRSGVVDRAATKASCGTSTRPMVFIRFLPSFCRSSSLRLRVMSPP